MPRLRRYLPPLLILLPVTFVCGKLLLTPVDSAVGGWNSDVGWPWVFAGVAQPPARRIAHFSWWAMLADVALFLAVLGAAGALLLLWYRRTGGRWQLSLRGLLVATLAAALVVAWAAGYGKPWQRQERCLKAWKASGITLKNFETLPPEWARRLLPQAMMSIFRRGTSLSDADCTAASHAAAVDAAFRALGELPDVREIEFTRCHEPVTIGNARALRHIQSIKCWADDDTLQAFSAAPNLHTLSVYGPMTDRGLELLKGCRSLSSLEIISNRVTNAGMRSLLDLPNLAALRIYGCPQISPETVELLKQQIPSVHAHGSEATQQDTW